MMLTQSSLTSFVTFNPISLREDSTLADAAWTLAETGIHQWPVVDDDQHLVGIFSERDILRTFAQGATEDTAGGPQKGSHARTQTVGTSMCEPIRSVAMYESPRQVLGKLLDLEVNWLPVLQDDIVVGVTTLSDFLREFSYGQLDLSKTQISDVMEATELICGQSALDQAWTALLQQTSGCLGVVRGNFPLGVISERDVRLATCRIALSDWFDGQAAGGVACCGPRTVLELVSAAPTIRPGERLQDAATLMLDHNRQAIAVVNQANRMMGAVTEQGILRRMHSYLI